MTIHDEIFDEQLHKFIHRHHSFLANYDFNSRMSFDLINIENKTTRERIEKRKAKNINDEMKKI